MKNVTPATQEKLPKVIQQIVTKITGCPAEEMKLVFFKDSSWSHKTSAEVIGENAKDNEIALGIISQALKMLGLTMQQAGKAARVIAGTIPTTDGWITAFYSNRDKKHPLGIHAIHDAELDGMA